MSITVETPDNDEASVWIDDGHGNPMHCIGIGATRAIAVRNATQRLLTLMADLYRSRHDPDCAAVDDDEEARCNCAD